MMQVFKEKDDLRRVELAVRLTGQSNIRHRSNVNHNGLSVLFNC